MCYHESPKVSVLHTSNKQLCLLYVGNTCIQHNIIQCRPSMESLLCAIFTVADVALHPFSYWSLFSKSSGCDDSSARFFSSSVLKKWKIENQGWQAVAEIFEPQTFWPTLVRSRKNWCCSRSFGLSAHHFKNICPIDPGLSCSCF